MSETKAEKEAREKHEAWEREQEGLGHSVHLPRAGEPGSTGYVAPDDGKKKSGK